MKTKFTYGIQEYWTNELGDLYNVWYNWFLWEQPARTISNLISQFVPKNKKELDILDCACGTGNPSLALKRMGFNVLSSDGSAKMLMKASENAQLIGVDLNLVEKPVVWSELTEVFPECQFDVIVCTGNAICHVPPRGVRVAIRQMSRVLKSGGLCIIDVKRYSERIRELHYEEDRGWAERSVRRDRRYFPDGRGGEFLTKLSYEGEDVPGRLYRIELDLSYSDGEYQHYVFPVWAITSSMVLQHMQDPGLDVLPLYPTPNPLDWKYDFCIGRRR
jgi:SAM-dependent methyltransferase